MLLSNPMLFYKNKDKETERNYFNNERLAHKLSLRKKIINKKISEKRIISSTSSNININIIDNKNTIEQNSKLNPNNRINIKWNLELNINNFQMPKIFQKTLKSSEELINEAMEYLLDEDSNAVKYGIYLLKNMIKNEVINENNEELLDLNANFIEELLCLLKEFCFKKEKEIVFNVLYIINKYISITKNKNAIKILTESYAYKIWELCFFLKDNEILCQLLLILNNVSSEKLEYKVNLIFNNFLSNTFINLFRENQALKNLVSNMSDTMVYNNDLLISKFFVEKGLSLFKKIIDIKLRNIDNKYKEKIFKVKKTLLEIFITYSDTNSEKIYSICVLCIAEATSEVPDLLEFFDISKLLEKILSQKNDFDEETKVSSNKILGNYISIKDGLSHGFLRRVVEYNLNLLFSINNIDLIIKDILRFKQYYC